MKKFLVVFFLLLILGGVGFFFGWINFFVPADSYAVMVTKTGGYDSVVIGPETGFVWRWENILPTNMTIYSFSMAPYTTSLSSTGTLPSSDVYGQVVPNTPDFSYTLDFTVSFHVNPASLLSLVRDKKITPETLPEWYNSKKEYLKQLIIEKILLLADTNDADIMNSSLRLEQAIMSSVEDSVSDIIVLSISANDSLKLPDPLIYSEARKNYKLFSDEYRDNQLAKMQRTRQLYEVADITFERSVIQLEKYGELLEKYPVLLKYLYITNHRSEASAVVPEIKNLFTDSTEGAAATE